MSLEKEKDFLDQNNYIVCNIKCCGTCIHSKNKLRLYCSLSETHIDIYVTFNYVNFLGICDKWEG